MLIEAMTAASEFIDENVRKDFLIIGGAALARYGSLRKTDDIDIAITAETLNVFVEKAKTDPRFAQHPDGEWTYTCQEESIEGLGVRFEFLQLGGPFLPEIRGVTTFGAVQVASLADIVLMKAFAYRNRGEVYDLDDMKFALRLMAQKGETFQDKFKESEMRVIDGVADEEMKNLLAQVAGAGNV
jgi:hypothetical protein